VRRFIREFSTQHDRTFKGIAHEAMQRLVAAPWPGNVRQLRNAIETAVLISQGASIDVPSLPTDVAAAVPPTVLPAEPTAPVVVASDGAGTSSSFAAESAPAASIAGPEPGGAAARLEGLVLPLEEVERILVRNALRLHGGNREHAARALGISERTLYRKIRLWGPQVTS
jgi:DNA-binding NtrC family response regulator